MTAEEWVPAWCPQCGCPAEAHWPENGRVTTACVFCLGEQRMTYSSIGRGFCCYPAADIRKANP